MLNNNRFESVWSVFLKRVNDNPYHNAIVDSETSLNYLQIANLVKKLSKHLLQYQGNTIGLIFNHSYEMIIAMLACLKNKSTYVCISPNWPINRQKEIIKRCNISALIVDKKNLILAKSLISSHIFKKIEDFYLHSLEINEHIKKNSFKDVAYILFTSGSTGKPKGVMQTEQNLLAHVKKYANSLKINETDSLSLLPPYFFDAAVMDIYGALISGAKLVLYDVFRKGVNSLPQFFLDSKLTIIHIVPSLLRAAFKSYKEGDTLKNVRFLVLGGEESTEIDVNIFKKHFSSSTILVNGYGPSESTVAFQKFIRKEDSITGKIPIGLPVEGVEFDLNFLEKNNEIGELVIKSKNLALGYLDDIDLTREKFKQVGQLRHYNTGDLFKYDSNGELVFISRADNALKINGILIDTGEIESTLCRHPNISSAAVIYNNELQGLVAFISTSKPSNEIKEESRVFLLKELPSCMVPSHFVVMKNLPLSSNGKIDKHHLKALSEKDRIKSRSRAKKKALDKVGNQVIEIWQNELNNKNIIASDSFYSLGGDSLQMINVMIQIEKQFSIDISLYDLITNPTVNMIVQLINRKKHFKTVELKKSQSPEIRLLPLSLEQFRYWKRLQTSLSSTAFNITYSMTLEGELNPQALFSSINDLIDNNWILQVSICEEDKKPAQVLKKRKDLNLEEENLSTLSVSARNKRLRKIKEEELSTPFKLMSEGLIRFRLIRMKKSNYCLLITFSHLLMDGWSTQVMIKELLDFYSGRMKNRHKKQKKTKVQYFEYINNQRNKDLSCPKKEKFWKTELEDMKTHFLLGDYLNSEDSVHIKKLTLTQATSIRIKELCQSFNITAFSFFMTVLRMLIFKKTGIKNSCFTTDYHGREKSKYKDTLGLFTNVIPLPFRLVVDQSFKSQLITSHQCFASSLKNALSFPQLIEAIFPGNLNEYDKIFPLAFIFQNDRKLSTDTFSGIKVTNIKEIQQNAISRDVIFEVISKKNHFEIELYFKSGIFSECVAKELLSDYKALAKMSLSKINYSIKDLVSLF